MSVVLDSMSGAGEVVLFLEFFLAFIKFLIQYSGLVRCAGSCFIIITLGFFLPRDAEVGKFKHILGFIEFQANLETRTC